MTNMQEMDYDDIKVVDSWAYSATDEAERSRRRAWIVASIAAGVAFLEAIALVSLMPLKTVEPYTLLVDRQTGYVEAIDPISAQVVQADEALTRSFLVQYVIARESYDQANIERDYRKVALMTGGDARQRYEAEMADLSEAGGNGQFNANTRIGVQVRSVSQLSADGALVRYSTSYEQTGTQAGPPQHWAAVINYRYSGASMSAEDRLINPLGFQVTRYRSDPETLPEVFAPVSPAEPDSRAVP